MNDERTKPPVDLLTVAGDSMPGVETGMRVVAGAYWASSHLRIWSAFELKRPGLRPFAAKASKEYFGTSKADFGSGDNSKKATHRDIVIPAGEVKAGVRRVLGRRVCLSQAKDASHGETSYQGRAIDSSVGAVLGAVTSRNCSKERVM